MSRDYGTLWAQSVARPMAERWWATALRGVAAILLGLAAVLTPGAALLSFVLVFAIYALVDGVAELVVAARCAGSGCGWRRWAPAALSALASVAAAAFAALWPQITVLAFVLLLAAWSIVSGVMMLAQAFRVVRAGGLVWLAVGGVVSLLFGAALIVAPVLGAVVLTWWLGAYALFLGGALLATAFRQRALWRSAPPSSQRRA